MITSIRRSIAFCIWWISWLAAGYVYGQSAGWVMDDLAYALANPTNREQVMTAIQQFQTNTQVSMSVTSAFEQDVYHINSEQQRDQWLRQQAPGIAILLTLDKGTKAFRTCEIQVSPAVEVLLPVADCKQIRTGLMEFYFRNSPVPTDAYTEGLLAGIAAMEKKILENKEQEKNKLPDDVVAITYIDKEFAAGIDDDKLKIKYMVKKEYAGKLQAAKLEVYKAWAKKPCFVTTLETNEENEYQWDGKLSEKLDDYITYKDSPFTIKITVSEDEEFEKVGVAEEEAWVDKEADEFRLYKNYAEANIGGNRSWTSYQYYKNIRSQIEENIIAENPNLLLSDYDDNPLKYYTENVTNNEFLGRIIKVHKNYKLILEKIESKMGKPNGIDYKKYKDNVEYTINGFRIRFQNDVDKISNHSFGMAIDVDATYNPQLYQKELAFISLLSNYNMVWQKNGNDLSVEQMKNASINLKKLEVTDKLLDRMRLSLLAIDHYNELKNVYMYSDLVTGTLGKELDQYIKNFNSTYQRIYYLSNERHFFDDPLRYTKKEASDAKKEFYKNIPKKCQEMRKKLIEFKEKANPLYELFKNHYKYAFFLDKNFKEQYEHVENYLRATLSQAQNMVDILLDLEQLIASQKIPSCFSCEVREIDNGITYNELLAIDLHTFLSWIVNNNQNIYKTEKFDGFAKWIGTNKQQLIGLCQRGFFRIDNKFVYYFLDHKEVKWGGFFKDRNDWMHFEIDNKHRQF